MVGRFRLNKAASDSEVVHSSILPAGRLMVVVFSPSEQRQGKHEPKLIFTHADCPLILSSKLFTEISIYDINMRRGCQSTTTLDYEVLFLTIQANGRFKIINKYSRPF